LKNRARAGGCAVFNYPFLTQKERDVETGLDYFEARYYSSAQGRFTSPDEFTGGPEELYYFADDASANPTFYSDLRRPQSLNKYQYAYNNPLRWIDPDGHEPDDDPQKKKKEEDIDVVVIKTVDPKIVSFDVKLIDKVPNTGEVPVGGEFEIKYKYVINEPTDGSKPEDAGSIAPITPKGTFTESNQVGLVNSTAKVDKEKEAVTVEKTERYVVNERRESKPGATAAINYKIVVKDPNTGRVVERRSTEGRGNKYIPLRNVPKEPRKK
jgi:RHS repeat-associated protein